MQCPQCDQPTLKAQPTTTGVELDRCSDCGGVWLDRGELFFFVRDVPGFQRAIDTARRTAAVTERRSPKGGDPLVAITLPAGQTGGLDRSSGGLWLPGSAVSALSETGALAFGWQPPGRSTPRRFKLPDLLSRTIFTMTGLYALLSFALITLSLYAGLSAAAALGIAAVILALQFALGPFLLDLSLRFLYRSRRVELSELPEHLQRYVAATARTHDMAVPRFTIIEDLSPNAFTYGHTPNNARIVLTAGMFELLDERELEGVVGHEIGHARNWDMLLMTAAQLVPLVLYYIYRTALDLRSNNSRTRSASRGVAVGAYLLYIVSQYVVLWFSRTREYYADRFGARSVGSAAALGRALVKIAYGLASRGDQSAAQAQGAAGGQRLAAIGALGIFDGAAARSLALTSRAGAAALPAPADKDTTSAAATPASGRYHIDGEALQGAMKWDLWNPWALYFELHSTHPLVAKRLLALSALSEELGEEPLVRFDLPQPESYWDEFAVDVAINSAPVLLLLAALGVGAATGLGGLGGMLLLVAAAMMVKLRFTYPTGSFPEMSVATLLRQVKVSGVRPVPCRLNGAIRGKGVPGLIWSDDFVMQDDTGIMLLDHRQPLALWEGLWGWLRGNRLIGEDVQVEGWYRRAPVPFVEILHFTVNGVRRRSWLRLFRWGGAVLVALGGLALLIASP